MTNPRWRMTAIKKVENRHISAMVLPIGMKFGKVTCPLPCDAAFSKNFDHLFNIYDCL